MLRLITCLLAAVAATAVGSVVIYLLLGQAPPAAAQEAASTVRIPRAVTVVGADGTEQTQTIFEEVRVPAKSPFLPATVVTHLGSFPLTATDRRSLELAARLRQTVDTDEQERLRGELIELLGNAFDERRKLQQQEMERLEARLKSIRELDQRRQELKDKIVERRLNELLGKGDELAWETSLPATIGTAPIPSARQRSIGTAPIPSAGQPPQTRSIPIPSGLADADDPVGGTPQPQPPVTRARSPASSIEIPNLGLIPSEQSFELAERVLTLATETATWKHRLASAKEEVDVIKNMKQAQSHQLQRDIQDSNQAMLNGYESALDVLRSKLVDSETKLRLALIAWQGIGERLQIESDAAQRQVHDGDELLKQIMRLLDQGVTPTREVDKAKQESASAKSQAQIASSRLHTWTQLDGVLQERLKAILTPDAEPANTEDTEDAAQDSTEAPKSDEAAENDPS